MIETRPRSTTELTNLLRDHGITATLQRVEIANVMLSKRQHVSAEQVLAMVNDGRAIASKATVYNTLRLLAKQGLVKEIIADPTKVFYEPLTTEHHHFYNVDTGELIDFEADFPLMEKALSAPAGMSVVGVDVTVRVHSAGA